METRARGLGLVCTAVVAAATLAALTTPTAAVPASRAAAAGPAPAAVTIAVRLDPRGRGTFTITGAASDSGRAVARRTVAAGRIRTTQTLTGRGGRLVITSARACTRTTGTWKVVSGVAAYAAATGGGASSEPTGCARPTKASRATYRGVLVVPPPPLATPGGYRGWTVQDKEISFEVTRDGRSLTGILIGPYRYECVRSDGLKMPASSGTDRIVSGPVPIAEDGTFVVEVGPARVEGRLAPAGTRGTITVASAIPPDAQGRTATCSGSIAWTASTPAPPAWRALSGTYCGFSAEGQSVCLDVAEDGRSVRNLRARVVVACGMRPPFDPRFVLDVTYDTAVPLLSDLSFRAGYAQRLETDGSAQAFLQGTFDRSGAGSGMLTLQQPTFTRDGTRYACRNGGGSFAVKLQR
jgi:hypothetical protein